MRSAVGARHGLSFPHTRVRAPTPAQLRLLEDAGEEEFSRWLVSRAYHHGWDGWHPRDSEGVFQSVHSLRLDGYSEAYGIPDWFFWHEGRRQSFWAELKGASGHLGKYQRRAIPSMRMGGATVFVWYPRDALTVERIFRDGLAQEDVDG